MQKLLLVEDDADRLKAISRAAAGEDRDIILARDRTRAISVLNEQDIDLVVTDLALQSRGVDEDGFEVLQAAKAKDENLPVILISAYLSPKKSERAFSIGAFDIIDRGSAILEPDDMLRFKIKLALRFRRALQEAAALKLRFANEPSGPA
ncbi:MAG: response regulator [Bryobacteraceae bacterium]